MTTEKKIEQAKEFFKEQSIKSRSAWDRGVSVYVLELLEESETIEKALIGNFEKALLNGCENWKEYSYFANSLVCDYDIAKRLCTPSEFKRVTKGETITRDPNPRENWLECQARALYQAGARLKEFFQNIA